MCPTSVGLFVQKLWACNKNLIAIQIQRFCLFFLPCKFVSIIGQMHRTCTVKLHKGFWFVSLIQYCAFVSKPFPIQRLSLLQCSVCPPWQHTGKHNLQHPHGARSSIGILSKRPSTLVFNPESIAYICHRRCEKQTWGVSASPRAIRPGLNAIDNWRSLPALGVWAWHGACECRDRRIRVLRLGRSVQGHHTLDVVLCEGEARVIGRWKRCHDGSWNWTVLQSEAVPYLVGEGGEHVCATILSHRPLLRVVHVDVSSPLGVECVC